MTINLTSHASVENSSRPEAVVIGASYGAVEALSVILPRLPRTFPLPIMVVVHMPPDNKSVMVSLFRSKCQIMVKEAEDKEPICGGIVYFAPSDYHLLVEADHSLSLSSEEPVHFSRPSVDVLFETAAEAYGSGLVGIILTGSNNDGAHGLQAVEKAGGMAWVQSPDLAHAPAMPQAAFDACSKARAFSLEQIAMNLQELSTIA